MARLTGVQHYLQELSILEQLKEEVAKHQADGEPATIELAAHVRGMRTVLQSAFDWIPQVRKPVFQQIQDEALHYIGRF